MLAANHPPPELPERIAAIIIAALQSDKGVHAETAIAAAAVLAGEYSLRAAGFDISGLTPGSPVLSEAVNEILFDAENRLTVSDVFINALYAEGIEVGKDSWSHDIPENHLMMMDPLQVVARVRAPINELMDTHQVEPLERAYLVASATALLVAQTRRVLNPDIGKALAMEAMLKGAKTVPVDVA